MGSRARVAEVERTDRHRACKVCHGSSLDSAISSEAGREGGRVPDRAEGRFHAIRSQAGSGSVGVTCQTLPPGKWSGKNVCGKMTKGSRRFGAVASTGKGRAT
ncbi:hypothetical protein GCM10009733_085790 [Nonomuraea maheshkhaliensis]|uniref:Uncharacterized protein n=1 Tax=Nonomuraea maheshkhaliensis TaxID=419590 RepID=A0ABN2GRE3_9ACTN